MPWRFNPFTGNLDETDIPAFNGEVTLGSAASPSIFFTGDPNTGIYSPGADQVAISTNGSERFKIDSSGNITVDTNTFYVDAANNRVGVGTTSPSQLLDLKGSAASLALTATGASDTSQIYWLDSADAIQGYLRYDHGAESLAFAVNGASEKMRIDSSGRLLVGTSTYSGNSKVAVADSISVLPASYDGASEISSFKALTLASIAPANQLRVTFTLPTNITGYGGFFVAELLVKASFDNASFPELGGIYKIRVGGVSTGTTTATSFLTTEVLYTASTQGNWTAITTGDVAVNAVSGTELTLDIDNPGGANYRYNVFTQYAHNCSNIALSSVAA